MVAYVFALLLAAVTPDLTVNPIVRAAFRELLADARYGFSETEEAAFVVRHPDGCLSFVRWPSTAERREARWYGAFPRGTIAIVHTHPNHTPHPSRLDERAARQKNIPIYVLTRTKITRTTGGPSELVLEGDWFGRQKSEGRRQK